MKRFCIILTLIAFTLSLQAQLTFRNLTADEVKIDSVLPNITYTFALPENHNDSVYTLCLLYPEYMEMTEGEVSAYKHLCDGALPGMMPNILQYVAYSRKKPIHTASFCPIVFKDGKYQFLVSFKPELKAEVKKSLLTQHLTARATPSVTRASTSSNGRYADHSVLSSGKWAKIRVGETGIYELTNEVIKKAGFSSLDKVQIYGYGGNLVPEVLTDEYLRNYDDLHEVNSCTVGGRRLFYAKGPVSWESKSTTTRTRNPYSDYGYYFITESNDAPATCSEEELLKQVSESNDIYHHLHEKDEFAWYKGGRNLFENAIIESGKERTYTISNHESEHNSSMEIVLTAGANTRGEVYVNDEYVDDFFITLSKYDKGNSTTIFYENKLGASNTVKIKTVSGGPARLDYISIATETPAPQPALSTDKFPAAEYVYNITNQDLHADRDIDMVIIVPTSQNTITQAERLKAFHETYDSLKVRIVPADELFNEFSSGTPDASAYKRYMKMLYDRAESDEQAPRYLLLFGDCVFDNRMNTADLRNASPDNYLLCFESENSFNSVSCYVSDDFFALLDDDEQIFTGGLYKGIPDIAVGRFNCSNAEEATVLVDKTIGYATSSPSGAWQNTLMFLGDDGNQNTHMEAANNAADMIRTLYPGYNIKKVMWDAYTRTSSSTGHRYPDVTNIIKKQQNDGALLIDYAGHGSEISISHETVLTINDFADFTNNNLSLWITASCDIMPFDGTSETIGETAMLNSKGGAVAFYGTTRTVYASYNAIINRAFLKHVLSYDSKGRPMTLGEANRLTKQQLVTEKTDLSVNKMQYSLLGDPALRLALPTQKVVIDSIDGKSIKLSNPQIHAGQRVRISGHIDCGGVKDGNFNGLVNCIAHDTEETITCKLNDTTDDGADKPFVYKDRRNTLFQGTDSVHNGQFSFIFAVPKDINYDNGNGCLTLYAIDSKRALSAHGDCTSFNVGGSGTFENDSIGPSIYCYLNTPEFSYGGTVNSTPFFVAELSDKDGINASGAGIGHDMQLIIDNDITKTYTLNDNFQFDFGSYTSGQTYYMIPELSEGEHTLLFRAWDIQNNSSTAKLAFRVQKRLKPGIANVALARNPVSEIASFIINHDRIGANIDVEIEVMDASGRLLWKRMEHVAAYSNTHTTTWDLTLDNGMKLQTGVYLYNVKLRSDGSSWTSKAKKMIVLR